MRKIDICALCHEAEPLIDSHIIPEFFYRNAGVYNDDHSYSVIRIQADLSGDVVGDRRLGIYERLLCQKCEDSFQILDDYAAKTLWGGTILGYSDGTSGCTVHAIDYSRMKLFELSLLWRIGVSQRTEFSHIRLLASHEVSIRSALSGRKPMKRNDYGCAMVYLINPPEVPLGRAILIDPIKHQGQNCVRLLLGGFLWIFVVSANLKYFKGQEFFLNSDGTRVVPMYPSIHLIDWLSSTDLAK